jgi:hypothetical protein
VHATFEWFDLFQQAVCQFLTAANRDRRYVVYRFVWIKLGALTTGLPDRIDNLGFEAEESKFEYLEQAARARANYHYISCYHKPGSSILRYEF